MSFTPFVFRCSLIAAIFFECLSCSKPQYPYSYEPIEQPVANTLLTDTSGQLVRERWWVHRLGDAKLGRRWWREFQIEQDGQTFHRHVIIDELQIPRFGTPVRQSLRWISLVDADGRLQQFAYTTGDGQRSLAAEVKRGELVMTDTTGKSSRTTRQPWDPAMWAYPQLVDYVRQQKFSAGTHATPPCFVPLSDNFGNLAIEVTQLDPSALAVPFASQPEPARMSARVFGSPSAAAAGTEPLLILWLDEDYQVIRESRPQLGYETVPCDELAAVAPNTAPDLDIATQFFVEVDDSAAGDTSQVAVYEVSSKTLEPSQFFEPASYQEVRRITDGFAEVRVANQGKIVADELGLTERPRQGTDDATFVAATSEPIRADAQPNRYLNFQHPDVRKLAASASGRLREPAELAEALRQLVYRRLDKSYEIVGLPTASSVIGAKAADCNGHAVLLAALCRARGLPARVVVGLRREGSAMYFHMWTETWYERAWHPLDATSAEPFSTDHLKIRSDNLSGDYEVSLLAPVLKIVNNVKVVIR